MTSRHLINCAALIASGAFAASSVAAEDDLPRVDQATLNAMVANGQTADAFIDAFEAGDELTEFSFSAEQGVGANIGEGRLFTRVPRADLTGEGEWATHIPKREGGANATSCIACHNAPFANGAGDVALNAVVDPDHTGNPALFLERNTLPLFALGIPQRIAEEMSMMLYVQKVDAERRACETGTATVQLVAKGVNFGDLSASRTAAAPCEVVFDTSAVEGIDDDLVVRAFGWKGTSATIREFTRGAAHNELGMQAVELVGDIDGDYDGVTDELTVGDMTALTIYMAGLERPVSEVELADQGLMELDDADRAMIAAGSQLFDQMACSACHVPAMTISNTTFAEPTTTPGFFDVAFPDGSDPAAHGLTPETAIQFDLAADQPNNQLSLDDGSAYHLGALQHDADGVAYAMWYSDFKRHDMGDELADPSDPLGIGARMFLTRSLAGVGATGPWLHDGRATTLADAILAHGGEAKVSRDAFAALSETEQAQVVRFLENLTYYSSGEEEDH